MFLPKSAIVESAKLWYRHRPTKPHAMPADSTIQFKSQFSEKHPE
jgi:hypothetical protein